MGTCFYETRAALLLVWLLAATASLPAESQSFWVNIGRRHGFSPGDAVIVTGPWGEVAGVVTLASTRLMEVRPNEALELPPKGSFLQIRLAEDRHLQTARVVGRPSNITRLWKSQKDILWGLATTAVMPAFGDWASAPLFSDFAVGLRVMSLAKGTELEGGLEFGVKESGPPRASEDKQARPGEWKRFGLYGTFGGRYYFARPRNAFISAGGRLWFHHSEAIVSTDEGGTATEKESNDDIGIGGYVGLGLETRRNILETQVAFDWFNDLPPRPALKLRYILQFP